MDRPLNRKIIVLGFLHNIPLSLRPSNSGRHGARALTFPTDRKVDRVVANFTNNPLCELFIDLQILVHAAQAPVNLANLTHEALFAVVDKAIASLSALEA